MQRRAFTAVSATAAFAAAFALGGTARADDPVKLAAIAVDPASEAFYAVERGSFAKAGIDVTLTVLPNAGTIAAAMIGGTIDVGLIDVVSLANAHIRGVPLVFLAPAGVSTSDHPSNALMVAKTSPLKTGKDFSGKIVATASLRNINQVVTETWIDHTGGDAKSVKFIELPYLSMAGALRAGTIDAASTVEPWLTATHGEFRVVPTSDGGLGDRYMVSGWAARTDWIAAHLDIARKFAVVMRGEASWANANPKLSEPILAKYAKIAPDVLATMGRVAYGERLEPALVQPLIDAGAKSGVLPSAFPATEIVSAAGR
jgi:NitT/TauT family transport system substrate-binding protein